MLKKYTRLYRLIATCVLAIPISSCGINGSVRNTENACSIFFEHHGAFNNWYKDTLKASLRYDVPMPIILATIKAESGFRPTVRTKWRKALGFIPLGHVSSAYGYAQALNGTWQAYIQSTGNTYAIRSSYADAVDFIAWYYRRSMDYNGIDRNDAYHLYISYVMGWEAYKQVGDAGVTPKLKYTAMKVANQAKIYREQLSICIGGF